MIPILVERGVDIMALTDEGESVLTHALMGNDDATIAAVLEAAGDRAADIILASVRRGWADG